LVVGQLEDVLREGGRLVEGPWAVERRKYLHQMQSCRQIAGEGVEG
jgi:hypothetical protein